MSALGFAGFGLLVALGLAGTVISASEASPPGLLVSTGAVSLMLAAAGIKARAGAYARAAAQSTIESITARFMSYVWLWGALSLAIVYASILSWREWTHFVAAFTIAGVSAFGFSRLLARDAATGREDPVMLRFGRRLAGAQLAGMVVTVIGLMIDPDKEILTAADGDWAGNGIFIFGALALAALSADAVFRYKGAPPSAAAKV